MHRELADVDVLHEPLDEFYDRVRCCDADRVANADLVDAQPVEPPRYLDDFRRLDAFVKRRPETHGDVGANADAIAARARKDGDEAIHGLVDRRVDVAAIELV